MPGGVLGYGGCQTLPNPGTEWKNRVARGVGGSETTPVIFRSHVFETCKSTMHDLRKELESTECSASVDFLVGEKLIVKGAVFLVSVIFWFVRTFNFYTNIFRLIGT